jgi:hypothetical protein
MARANGVTADSDRRPFLDEVADLIFDSAVYLPIAQPHRTQFLGKPLRLRESRSRDHLMLSEITPAKPPPP